MIDKQTLKKHNLKAVPFSCIREGETFYSIFPNEMEHDIWREMERRLVGNTVHFTDGNMSFLNSGFMQPTVYVPVWRVTEEI